MSIGYGPKWSFYSCDGLYWIVGIYVLSIMQGPKRSFLLGIVVYETLCGHYVYWDRLYTMLYLGRAPRTKETLPDFHEWRPATRHPLVFRGLMGSQRTHGNWGVTLMHSVESHEDYWLVWLPRSGRCLRPWDCLGYNTVMKLRERYGVW